MINLQSLLFSLILVQSSNADVSGAIGQLVQNDLATAKEVIKALDKITLDKADPEGKLAESISTVIKGVFVAEFNLQQATQKLGIEAQKADELDQKGRENLKPNALGSVNQIGADAKFKTARETRFNALERLTGLSEKLETALASLLTVGNNAELSERDRGILKNVAATIEKRTLNPADSEGRVMVQNVKSEADRVAAEDAAQVKQQDLQAAAKNREGALRHMQRAIRTGDKSDEARAMKSLIMYAPESVADFNDYLAAKAARQKQNETYDLERRIQELENR